MGLDERELFLDGMKDLPVFRQQAAHGQLKRQMDRLLDRLAFFKATAAEFSPGRDKMTRLTIIQYNTTNI